MEIDLALLADAATIDASGKLSILGIFDRIAVQDFPARHGRMSLILRLTAGVGEVGNHEMEIALRGPSGGELVKAQAQFQLGASPAALREGIRVPQVLNLDNVVFAEEGRYSVDVQVDGEHLVSLPLMVMKAGGARA